jgi:hypothetical protein
MPGSGWTGGCAGWTNRWCWIRGATTGSTCWWIGSRCAPSCASVCCRASKKPCSLPTAWCLLGGGGTRGAAVSAPSLPACAATYRWPSWVRVPSPSTALRRLHRLRRARRALGGGSGEGGARREQDPARRCHPALGAARSPAASRGAGRSRGAPGLLARGALRELPKKARQALLQGDGTFPGALPYLRKRVEALLARGAPGRRRAGRAAGRRRGLRGPAPLPDPGHLCHLRRRALRQESLAVRLGGRSVAEYVHIPSAARGCFFEELSFPERNEWWPIACCRRSGAGSASWNRWAWAISAWTGPPPRLSSGERNRIRLASQIGARLQGVLYVLDEPSVGLHQRDNERLLCTLKESATWATRCGGGARRGDHPRRRLRGRSG